MNRLIRMAVVSAAVLAAPLTGAAGSPTVVCAACVRANLERLAGDALHGRKCGSDDEHQAAALIVRLLGSYGIKGAFANGGYVQPVELLTPTFAAPPSVELTGGGRMARLALGTDMVLSGMPASLEAPLARVLPGQGFGADLAGKIVIYDPGTQGASPIDALKAGAAAVITPAGSGAQRRWYDLVQRSAGRTDVVGGFPHQAPTGGAVIAVKPDVFATLADLGEGQAKLSGARGQPIARRTLNVVGVLHGRARDADQHAILLSAHYDHLGVRDGVIYHGADDDASGTAAVLELARILGSGRRPSRTVYFALFGCEEEGGLGAQYFQAHPPEPLVDLVANLEFEMIGVDDPQHPGELMLTGWERSNLGPILHEHGAALGPDRYPAQRFFQRSDNYQLALRGVVAQTITAWALTPTYHTPSDDLAHVDLAFMDRVIGSLVEPIRWLSDSDFQPQWSPGGRP